MINKKLHKIRKKLDKLDDKFLLLIKKQGHYNNVIKPKIFNLISFQDII